MADDTAKPDEQNEGGAPKKKSKLPLIIGGVVGLLVLIGGSIGGYMMFAGGHEEVKEEAAENKAPPPPQEMTYMDFPELLISLRAPSGHQAFLKATLIFEIEKPEDKVEIEKQVPRIMDVFQVYLREIRMDDVDGPGGLDRLRDELLTRVNGVVTPAKVHNILFKQFLIQ